MRMRYTLLSVAALISASIPPRLFALHSENGINGPILRESAPPERIVDFEKNPNLEKSAPTRSTAGSLHDTVPFTIPTASSAEDYGPQKNGINQNSPSRHQSAALSVKQPKMESDYQQQQHNPSPYQQTLNNQRQASQQIHYQHSMQDLELQSSPGLTDPVIPVDDRVVFRRYNRFPKNEPMLRDYSTRPPKGKQEDLENEFTYLNSHDHIPKDLCA
eukprot:Filipodium_phascolosomae@DN2191_c0_g1_i1.p1